ncbi:M36 family metallopeptidase [Pendulispora albinea]|uniref:M36 family metallopeptidase n=1 Tax=Pendulispora albinea TaxID=2741071 RepID=A0ABZ2M612_9BACT
MQFLRWRVAGIAWLAGASLCACSRGDAPPAADVEDEAAALAALASTPLGHVASRDARGAARLILAGTEAAPAVLPVKKETAARLHLVRHAALLGVEEETARQLVRTGEQAFGDGATVLQFAQKVGGVDVFQSRVSVVLNASKNLVSISAQLSAQAEELRAKHSVVFPRSAESALAHVYAEHFGLSLPTAAVRDLGPRGLTADFHGMAVVTPKHAPRVLDAAAKPVLFATARAVGPAYYVEMLGRAAGSGETEAYAYTIDAADGHVLSKTSLTASDSFRYRVWAEPDGNHIPADGPHIDDSPHRDGRAETPFARESYAEPILVSMNGFNTNPEGRADPWLPPGESRTFGNNVRAYSDRNDRHADSETEGESSGDGYEPKFDIVADVTSPSTFDRAYDVTRGPDSSRDQIKAATTQLFYVTNWMHDYWYDSGFDEASGVAQVSNYGRGGVEGDPLLAEAQDGADFGRANNAHITTFADGTSPRLEMQVWTGPRNRSLETFPPFALADGFGASTFGPQIFDAKGDMVLAKAPSGAATDACEPPINVAGKIAVVDRGNCPFTQKAANVQAAGGVGMLLLNDRRGHQVVEPDVRNEGIAIPFLSLSYEDGTILKYLLDCGATAAHMRRGREPQHDGTIDNTIIAHEWAHYMHHRLVPCTTPGCLGMSEGWGDFNALMMMVREKDLQNGSLDGGAYPIAQYATTGVVPRAHYFGIRRAPYSTDMAKNPFTFAHVRNAAHPPKGVPLAIASTDMAEVHNVGEVWASALFEGYVRLLQAGAASGRSFEQSKRTMANYVVASMKAAPPEPSFTEQRDALLAVVRAAGRAADFDAIAQGFAKRGFGIRAVAPPTSSESLDEAIPNFETEGELALAEARATDSTLTVRFRNAGWTRLPGTTISVTTGNAGVRILGDATIPLAALEPYGIASASLAITADRPQTIHVTVRVHREGAATDRFFDLTGN